MHFAPDTEDTLEFVVALCNTDAGASRTGLDELSTLEQLRNILDDLEYTGHFDRDLEELRTVRETRDLLRVVWSLPRDESAEAVNGMLRDARALPQLVRHGRYDWHLHATEPDAPLAERMRVEAALALADVIRMNENGRMRVCAAPDCTGILLDLSRNGSKQYCSVRCGNRMNQVAFRERVR